jgi:ATP-binding cassette subfamily C protein
MHVYRLLYKDLVAHLRWLLPVLTSLMALVGLTEGASVTLLLPLLDRLGLNSGMSQGVIRELIDGALRFFNISGTLGIFVLIAGLSAIQAALFIGLNWWMTRLARQYQRRRQTDLLRVFLRARWSFAVERRSGELTNAIITECERLGTAFTTALTVLSTAVIVLVYLVLALVISWPVTVSVIVVGLLSAVALKGVYRAGHRVGRSLTPLNARLQSLLSEQFAALKLIKATASEQRAYERIDPILQQHADASTFVSFLPMMVRGVLEFIAIVGLTLVLVVNARGVGVAPSNALVVIALFARLFPRTTTLQAQLHYLSGYVHSITEVYRLESEAICAAEASDGPLDVFEVAQPSALVIRDLCVEVDSKSVLSEASLEARSPGLTAIVGRSGAGKSTLVHVVLGLLEASAGTIHLGPYRLQKSALPAWRRSIGYVPQESFLFHATIWENLTFSNPRVTRQDVELAVQRAHADEFIAALPRQFETVIGDQGLRLSGGQRQRLAIARALLGNPQLLVLDEPMSALDAESEMQIMRTIEELRKQMGILLVAHRLASVQSADMIYLMDAGRVVECGTWRELISNRSQFHDLVEMQSARRS